MERFRGLFDFSGQFYFINGRKPFFTGRRRKQYDDTFIIPDCVIIITGSPGKVASGVSGEFLICQCGMHVGSVIAVGGFQWDIIRQMHRK